MARGGVMLGSSGTPGRTAFLKIRRIPSARSLLAGVRMHPAAPPEFRVSGRPPHLTLSLAFSCVRSRSRVRLGDRSCQRRRRRSVGPGFEPPNRAAMGTATVGRRISGGPMTPGSSGRGCRSVELAVKRHQFSPQLTRQPEVARVVTGKPGLRSKAQYLACIFSSEISGTAFWLFRNAMPKGCDGGQGGHRRDPRDASELAKQFDVHRWRGRCHGRRRSRLRPCPAVSCHCSRTTSDIRWFRPRYFARCAV